MARFSRKDIFFKDNDMAVFGTDQDSRLYWDDSKNELTLTSAISGVDPTQGYHLATKDYVDTTITGVVSGDYVKRDGTTTLTNDWDVGSGKYILTDFLKARDDGGIFLYTYNESAHLHLEDHTAAFSTTSGVSISAESVSIDLGTNPQTDINLVSKYEADTDKSNIRVSSEITALGGTLVEFYGIATQVDVVTTSSGDVEYVFPFQTQTTNFGAGNIENFFGGYYNVVSNGEGDIAALNGTYISTTADGWDYESEEQLSSPGVVASMNGLKMATTICCGAPVGDVGGIAIDQPEIYGGGYATNAIGLYIEDWTVQSGGYGLNIASMGGLNMFAGPMVVGGIQTSPTHTFQVMNDAGTSHDIAVTQSGNVGFGVASPNYKVHVDGDGYFTGNVIAAEPTVSGHLATKQYVDDAVATVSGGGGGTSNHSELNELDYASSGHTGFAESSHTHDGRYYTESEVDTISGSLQTQIDNSSSNMYPYVVIDTIGEQQIQQTATVLNLDTEVIPNTNYSVSSGTITVNNSGVYWISYTMCFNQIDIDADTREALSAWVECNGAVISGSYSRNYFREAVFGGGISSTFLASLPSSCDVEVKFKYLAGGPNMDTAANESQVSMTKVG